jgi:hypothetical protein
LSEKQIASRVLAGRTRKLIYGGLTAKHWAFRDCVHTYRRMITALFETRLKPAGIEVLEPLDSAPPNITT